MADAPASSSSGFSLIGIGRRALRGDVAMGVGVLALLVMLLLPMPKFLLDGATTRFPLVFLLRTFMSKE